MCTNPVGFYFADSIVIGVDGSTSFVSSGDEFYLITTRGRIDKGFYADEKNVRVWFPLFVQRINQINQKTNSYTNSNDEINDYDDSDFFKGVAL